MGTQHVCFAELPQYACSNENAKKYLEQPRSCSSPSGSSNMSISPTPRYERNMGFFQQLSRRFGLRSNDDLLHDANTTAMTADDDANSSSTDSCSSSGVSSNYPHHHHHHNHHQQHQQQPQQQLQQTLTTTYAGATRSRSNSKEVQQGSSMEHMSCASSETSSTVDIEEQHESLTAKPTATATATGGDQCKTQSRGSFSRLHRRSTSSLRRAFESLSLTTRSLSCSGPSPPTMDQCRQQQPQQKPLKSALKCASNVELHKYKSSNGVTAASTSANTTKSSTSLFSSSSSGGGKCTKTKSKPPPQRILRQPVSYTYLKGMSGLPTQRVPRSSVCCQYARR